ncbi:MAG: leucine-rich repeat domain-containing protein [Oscillibacter sp.]|nr:leucine-rich repeat domain-containing protein [Oscillibacter sp.]
MINPKALETFGNYDKKSLMAGITVGQGLKGRARAPRNPAPAGFPQDLWDAASQRANAMIARLQSEPETPEGWTFDKDAFCFGVAAGRSLEGWEIDGRFKFNREIRYYIRIDSPNAVVIWLEGVTGNGENLFIEWGDSTNEDYTENHFVKYDSQNGYVSHNYENEGEYIITLFSEDDITQTKCYEKTGLPLGGVYLADTILYDVDSSHGTHLYPITPASSSALCAAYLNVTHIQPNAFSFLSGVEHVTISDSMTSIAHRAFFECTGLVSIIIPYSVTSIGFSAFEGCDNLGSVTIPGSVSSIEAYAFEMCRRMTSVTIGDGVTSIGDEAFAYCDALTNVTIPASVTSIDGNVFHDCENLASVDVQKDSKNYKSIDGVLYTKDGTTLICYPTRKPPQQYEIPDGVTVISDYAFCYCTTLTSVRIPTGVTSIGDYAFYHCTSLKSATIPEGVDSIGRGAFRECDALTSVMIPNITTSIGERAFYSCDSLERVYISGSVTSIGDEAFAYCTALTSVTIPDSVTSIGSGAFYYASLSDVYYGGTEEQWNEMLWGSFNTGLWYANVHYNSTGPDDVHDD